MGLFFLGMEWLKRALGLKEGPRIRGRPVSSESSIVVAVYHMNFSYVDI
jgi:hypothetical protein